MRVQVPSNDDRKGSSSSESISVEQVKSLIERIRSAQGGVFAPVYEQPALRAVLLPVGGVGGAQLIEYFINLKF